MLQPDEGPIHVMVRERRHSQPPMPTSPDSIGVELDRWAGEYVVAELSPSGLKLTAGPFGTVPLHVMATNDVLAGSWHLPDLRDLVTVERLHPRAVARVLSRYHRYSEDTVFSDVHQLTERATAVLDPTGCTITYPEPAHHVLQPRELRRDVDPVEALNHILGAALADIPVTPRNIGVEISGGADSANVALTLAEIHGPNMRSFGLAMPDAIGADQQQRRKTLTATFGFNDAEIPASDHPPFAPDGERARGLPHHPASSYYLEAFNSLVGVAADAGVKVMFSGLAGDEISALYSHERDRHRADDRLPSWLGPNTRDALADVDTNTAPVPILPVTALMAFAVHHPSYLRAGIWPVAPLANPMLVRFFEQLPRRWRAGKSLLRARLRRAGLPDEVVDPARPEVFNDVMEIGLRNNGLPLLRQMLTESVLIDTGYVDGDALASAMAEADNAHRIPSELCDAIGLEVGLRSLSNPDGATTRDDQSPGSQPLLPAPRPLRPGPWQWT